MAAWPVECTARYHGALTIAVHSALWLLANMSDRRMIGCDDASHMVSCAADKDTQDTPGRVNAAKCHRATLKSSPEHNTSRGSAAEVDWGEPTCGLPHAAGRIEGADPRVGVKGHEGLDLNADANPGAAC